MRSVKVLPRFVLALVLAGSALAYHVPPFASDHEVLLAIQGLLNNSPGVCRANPNGSPVDVATGNLIQTMPIFAISGKGPAINIVLSYNSFDKRKGPFGRGWSTAYDQRVIKATDGAVITAICAGPVGNRDRYPRNPDGSYSTPPFLNNTLTENPDGSFSLREKHGVVKTFDVNGRLVKITDRNGNSLSISYDNTGFMTSLVDASGRAVAMTKGADGRVASVTDPANRQFAFTYDANGNLTRVTDPLTNSTTLQYDSSGNVTSIADPKGNVLLRASYNADGTVSSYTERGETWTIGYNPASKQTTETDSGGNRWTHTYNDSGSITKTVDHFSNATATRLYDTNLNVTQSTDANGNATVSTYDSAGNPVTVKDALNNTITTTYDGVYNFPLTVTDRLGNVTTYTYDSRGNVTKITDPIGNVRQHEYDSKGQVIKVTDALGNATSISYNTYGNVLTITNPLNQTRSWTYDMLGNVTSYMDPNGKVTQSTFDANRRVTKLVDPVGGATTLQYDSGGNLVSITMPNGGVTSYQYDNLNRVQKVTNAIGKVTTYGYDRKDRLISRTNPNGITTTYVYDALSRLTARNGGSDPQVYTYDKAGNILTLRNTNVTLTFVYDAFNRVTQARTSGSSFEPNTTISYTYDANGQRRTLTDPAGGVTTYVYDAASRLTSIQDPSSQTFSFTYDKAFRRTGLFGPSGRSVAYSWDSASRLTGIIDQSSAGNVVLNYTLDSAGNILSKSDGSGNHSYSYDSLYRLTSASHPTGQAAETYSYDSMGNRTTSHLSAAYTNDAANRLTADVAFDYTYDDNGNLIRKTERSSGNVTAYTYDSENRLTDVRTVQGAVFSYKYDGLGRRIAKLASGVVTVQYVYDGRDIISEYSGAGGLVASYTRGRAVDEILSVRKGLNAISFQKDHLGTIVQSFSGTALNSSFRFDSYGRSTGQTGTAQSPYAFTGREYDSESGLYYYRARYYNPDLGRFMSEDPIGFSGGTNLYAYVSGNPISLTDPLGLVARLYWWPPSLHNGGINVGHSAVMLDDGTYISFWPESGAGLFSPGDTGYFNPSYANDVASEGGQPNVVQLTGLDQAAVKNWFDTTPVSDFNLYTHNCSNIAADALRAGGYFMSHPAVQNPASVATDATLNAVYHDLINWFRSGSAGHGASGSW